MADAGSSNGDPVLPMSVKESEPPTSLKITRLRLLNLLIPLSYGITKAVYSFKGEPIAPTLIELVVGSIVAAVLYLVGLLEEKRPPVLVPLLHESLSYKQIAWFTFYFFCVELHLYLYVYVVKHRPFCLDEDNKPFVVFGIIASLFNSLALSGPFEDLAFYLIGGSFVAKVAIDLPRLVIFGVPFAFFFHVYMRYRKLCLYRFLQASVAEYARVILKMVNT